MTHFPHINFSRVDRPQSDWSARVAAHLDALDAPVTPADLALVEAAAIGDKAYPRTVNGGAERTKALLDASRDAYGHFCLDGRAALIEVARERGQA